MSKRGTHPFCIKFKKQNKAIKVSLVQEEFLKKDELNFEENCGHKLETKEQCNVRYKDIETSSNIKGLAIRFERWSHGMIESTNTTKIG